MTSKTSNLR